MCVCVRLQTASAAPPAPLTTPAGQTLEPAPACANRALAASTATPARLVSMDSTARVCTLKKHTHTHQAAAFHRTVLIPESCLRVTVRLVNAQLLMEVCVCACACSACQCSGPGCLDGSCDLLTGHGVCRSGFQGYDCDRCAPGYFNYPLCQRESHCSLYSKHLFRVDKVGTLLLHFQEFN